MKYGEHRRGSAMRSNFIYAVTLFHAASGVVMAPEKEAVARIAVRPRNTTAEATIKGLGTCTAGSECTSGVCRGGNCCNAKGSSTGCVSCYGDGDCETCDLEFTRVGFECQQAAAAAAHSPRLRSDTSELHKTVREESSQKAKNGGHNLIWFIIFGIVLVCMIVWLAYHWATQDWSAISSHGTAPGLVRQLTNVSNGINTPLLTKSGSATVHHSFEHWCATWQHLAKTGELDIYTCVGLRNGFGIFGPKVRRYIPTIALLISMQAVLPLLLAFYEFQHFDWIPVNHSLTFRLIGFILYGYSVMHMYFGALDDCRTLFLEMSLKYKVPWRFLVPMLFGEVMNSLTSFVLTSTLFMVFCREESAIELVIKSIAVNFVTTVDNEWTSEQMRTEAIEDFEEFKEMVPIWEQLTDDNTELRNVLHLVIKALCCFLRIVGTLCTGLVLGLIFLFAHQGEFCHAVRRLDPGLICTDAYAAEG